MRKIPNSSRRLDEHISRALNKIKKPSTAEEITELLNRDLEPEDRPFQTKEVAERLRKYRRRGVDTLLVKDSSPQVALSRLRPRTRGKDQGLAANRKCFPPLQSYTWLVLR